MFLLSFSLVSAESFYAGETVQLYFEEDVSGMSLSCDGMPVMFSPLANEYRNNKWIVYFDLDESLANKTCVFFYSTGNRSFNVFSNENILRVKPGVVILSGSSFSLELKDVNGSFNVLVSSDNSEIVPRKTAIEMVKGESKNVYFDHSEIIGDSHVILSYDNRSYSILVIGEEEVVVNETVVEVDVGSLIFLVENDVNVTVKSNESMYGDLKVQNTYLHSVDNLIYSLTGNLAEVVSFNESMVDVLDSQDIFLNRIFVNRENNSRVGVYSGEILLSNDEYSVSLPMVVNVVEMNESVLMSNYKVFNQSVTFDVDTEESTGKGVYIIGIILIVLLLVFIFLVVLKLRQKGEKKFNEYIEETKRKK